MTGGTEKDQKCRGDERSARIAHRWTREECDALLFSTNESRFRRVSSGEGAIHSARTTDNLLSIYPLSSRIHATIRSRFTYEANWLMSD